LSSKSRHSQRGIRLGYKKVDGIQAKKKPKKEEPKSPRFNQAKFLKDLWTIWSIHIRSREADWKGFTHCISCGKFQHWKLMDAGHYHHTLLDFDDTNVNTQCKQCNGMKKGNPRGYAVGLIRKYGPGIIEELDAKKTVHYQNPKPDIIKLKALYEELHKKYGHLLYKAA
jgi:NinG protein